MFKFLFVSLPELEEERHEPLIKLFVGLDDTHGVTAILTQALHLLLLHKLKHLILCDVNDGGWKTAGDGIMLTEAFHAKTAALVLGHVYDTTNFCNHLLLELDLALHTRGACIWARLMRNKGILVIVVHAEVPVAIQLLVRPPTMAR